MICSSAPPACPPISRTPCTAGRSSPCHRRAQSRHGRRIELAPIGGKPTARAMEAFQKCFDRGLLIRTTGDIIAVSPPLIIENREIDFIVDTLGDVLKTVH